MKVEYVFKMRFVVEEKPEDEGLSVVEEMREAFKTEFAAGGDVCESSFDATRTVL